MADDKKKDFVLVQNGQRVSELQPQQEAQAEAQRLNKLNEAAGDKAAPKVEVKQNLFG